MGVYVRPDTLEEALAARARGPLTVLAGGTDIYPARVGRPLDDDILDITAIEALRGIARDGDGAEAAWRIGATTTWTDIIEHDLPPLFDGLKQAAREVGGWQVQNAGTVAGNLCNASPAADGVPALLALDAEVELSAPGQRRRLPLDAFVEGNRRTACGGNELVTAILVPARSERAVSRFHKLGARRYLVISIVMAAGLVERDAQGRVEALNLAVGACSETAQRLTALERELIGGALDPARVTPAHLETLSPIDDCRAGAGYRREAALEVVRRLIADLGAAA